MTSTLRSNLVMTVIGPDRPGLVESLAVIIAEYDGNWIESRMGHLAGQFAGILRVEVSGDAVEALTRQLRELNAEELSVIVHVAHPPEKAEAPRGTLALEIIGHDRPGIVSEITRVLTGFGINVESLETERLSAPMSGEIMFQARARILIPKGSDLDAIRVELERIASDLMVELRLEERA